MNITDLDPTTTIVATVNGSDYPARVVKSEVTLAGYVVITLSYRNSLGVWGDLAVAATTTAGEWHTLFGRLPVTFRPMEYITLRELAKEVADSEDSDEDWAAVYIINQLGLDLFSIAQPGETMLDEDQVEQILNSLLDLSGLQDVRLYTIGTPA